MYSNFFLSVQHPHKRVVSMDFSPTAEWLVCLVQDGTLYLVPVHSLLHTSPGVGPTAMLNPLSVSDKPVADSSPASVLPSLESMTKNALGVSSSVWHQLEATVPSAALAVIGGSLQTQTDPPVGEDVS